MEATATTATAVGRRRRTYDPPEHRKNTRAGGKYRTGGSGMEESAYKSVEWSEEETE